MPAKQKEAVQSPPSVLREFASVAFVVGLFGVVGYGFLREQLSLHHAETALIVDIKTTTTTQTDLCGPPTKDGRPITISMLYSDDKQAWIEDAAQSFSKACPNIQVKLTAMADIESADLILAGTEKPTLWAPADDLVVKYLDARWKKEKPHDKLLFDSSAMTSIAASPMVVLIWANRIQVMSRILATRPMEHGPWVDVACAQVPIEPTLEGVAIDDMVPGTWIDWYNPLIPPPPDPKARPAKVAKPKQDVEPSVVDERAVYKAPFPTLDQIKSWGRVKLGHTSPTRSAAGLEAIYLMAYDYMLPPAERPEAATDAIKAAMEDPAYRGHVFSSNLDKPDFERAFAGEKKAFGKWLRRCEAGLEPTPKSAGLLTDTFFNVGASRYDAIATYEHLVFKVLDHVDAYDKTLASMEVYYPTPTLMNEHPVVTIDADNLTEDQRLSASKWMAYLRSANMQKKAIEYGFRPVNRQVSIRDYASATNPFLRFRRYGVTFDSAIIEPPRLGGDVVSDIVRIWQDATGRN